MTQQINPVCKATGTHDWQETVSHTYRTCKRSGCRAAQRLVAGTWKHVTSSSTPREQQDTVSSSLLWGTQQWNALTFPYPGYDPERERYMEQQYHKAVTEEHHYRATHRTTRGGI
ncbi:hypothetical protein KSF_073080 [Reticulibacter mediterranei]|uniref:Uncharacterized protein n=1 Tax=Reticulibacter mediterranei TaxID=2778369 RepID=A0A8J3IUT4_9CHLR|nr:hypothetical protein [Reticulibacter mediterranei]GHO97260.1 hypothetical protein KSF_073080 [Reticulibacter mediterranei]